MGIIESNLVRLNDEFCLSDIPDLIARKLAGPERGVLEEADVAPYDAEVQRLYSMLERAGDESSLPVSATARPALDDLLVRARLALDAKAGNLE